jgi:hypothetical protein
MLAKEDDVSRSTSSVAAMWRRVDLNELEGRSSTESGSWKGETDQVFRT